MSKQQSKPEYFEDLAPSAPAYRPRTKSAEPESTSTGDSAKPLPNVGWLYYKDYFGSLDLLKLISPTLEDAERKALKAASEAAIKKKNRNLIFAPLPSSELIPENPPNGFELVTTYPGLVSGTGMKHETKQIEGELKLGFAFDHTTGLPYIPGSGIKGKLRSFFPNLLHQHAASQRDPELKDYLKQKADQLETYMIDVLTGQFPNIAKQHPFSKAEVALLESHIFDGIDVDAKQIGPYKRDVFYDAVAVKAVKSNKPDDKNSPFLAMDSITPHPHPLKNLTPIQFLKVGPGVTFRFSFRLSSLKINGLEFSAEDKNKLFKHLLLQHGAGAKTRVGYGQFDDK